LSELLAWKFSPQKKKLGNVEPGIVVVVKTCWRHQSTVDRVGAELNSLEADVSK
jgi:hypothetical protein